MKNRGIRDCRGREEEEVSVITGMRFAASLEQAWDGLMFFEQIGRRPPLPLRLLLPAPVGAHGRRSAAGDETRCVYEQGYLVKRVTRVVPGSLCSFEVVEQELAIGGSIRLAGGSYTLKELPDGCSRVELETRYVSRRRPRWLWRPIEAAVCHAFHRHILGAIGRRVQSRGLEADAAAGERPLSSLSPGES